MGIPEQEGRGLGSAQGVGIARGLRGARRGSNVSTAPVRGAREAQIPPRQAEPPRAS